MQQVRNQKFFKAEGMGGGGRSLFDKHLIYNTQQKDSVGKNVGDFFVDI